MSAAYLPQVDEGRRLGHRGVVLKEAHVKRSCARVLQLDTKEKPEELLTECWDDYRSISEITKV